MPSIHNSGTRCPRETCFTRSESHKSITPQHDHSPSLGWACGSKISLPTGTLRGHATAYKVHNVEHGPRGQGKHASKQECLFVKNFAQCCKKTKPK